MSITHEVTYRRYDLGLAVACFVMLPCLVGAADIGSWIPGENMSQPRAGHTATLLNDGRVLVAGGDVRYYFSETPGVEICDPEISTWTSTGSLATRRSGHTATLLNDGRVLVAGGLRYRPDTCSILNSAEVYDPKTGAWSETGSLNWARTAHRAVLLDDGRVLVVGGFGGLCGGAFDHAELYDPKTGTWTVARPMNVGRRNFTATSLRDGRVLVAGGMARAADGYADTFSAEVYDPGSGSWSIIASMNKARSFHTAILLTNGRVLVAGSAHTTVEIYDPARDSWRVTGESNIARTGAESALLRNGRVLFTAGFRNGQRGIRLAVDSAELYDPDSESWDLTAGMNVPRAGHTVTLLSDGRVLVIGGRSREGDLPSPTTEFYGKQ